MSQTTISELSTLARSGNGASPHAPHTRRLKGLGGGARASDSLQGGRTVQKVTDKWQFNGVDTQKRPFGREEGTLNALRTLRDLDPQASHAVWNYLRMVNPGHDLRTFTFDGDGSETKEEGPAQDYLDSIVRRVGAEYGGGLDQLHNVLALGLITTGAVCAEVAPTADLDDIEDWYPVDPTLITFRRDDQGTLHMGQRYRDNTWRELNPNQVYYVPLDPDVDDPYGRPPLLPALNATLAKGQMLNDLRAVAHNQGYPRLDVSIDWEMVMASAPPSLREPGREPELQQWTEGVLSGLVTDYESLQVDDTFVHYNWVKIAMVGGAAGVGAFDFAALEKILTRQVNSALKTLPILLGINEATSETHGSIQWQIQVQGVQALQRLIKRVVEKLANASLQIKGLQAHAKVEYQTIRTVDRLFEAQADFFETRTIQIQEMMGWRGHDEAAEKVTGHAAEGPILDTKTPQPNLSTNTGGDTSQNLNSGTNPKAGDSPPVQKQEPGGWAAWQLMLEPSSEADTTATGLANRRWASLRSEPRKPRVSALSNEAMDAASEQYVERTRDIFTAAYFDCVRLLGEEGYDFNSQFADPQDQWSQIVSADIAKDVSDYVFGVGYSREMKRLLRDAFAEGMRRAGIDIDAEYDIDDRLIERVWRTNRQFILKIRDELRTSLRSGEFKSLDDIKAWFDSRMWREDLMGRFLAKQGLAAGYAYGVSLLEGAVSFIWMTVGSGDTCPTCLSRSGQTFTYDELVSAGFPGSIDLECGANCRCSLSPE